MTAQDCLDCIQLLGAQWPHWIAKLDAPQLKSLTQMWATILADLDAGIVRAALASLLSDDRDFPPTVGQVNTRARALLAEARGECAMDAGEAWRLVCGALESFGHGVAWQAEKRAALPPAAVKTAEDFGLMRIRMRLDENAGTDFAQFRDIFNAIVSRERATRNTSPQITAMLAGVVERLRLNAPQAAQRGEVNNQ